MSDNLLVDKTWMHNISFNLERFKKVSGGGDVYNCRCPVCGDSKKNSRIARFYFYVKAGNLNVDCKNCGYGHSFYTFMKEVFPDRFEEYKKERLFDGFINHNKKVVNKTREPIQSNTDKERINRLIIKKLKNTTKMIDLPHGHDALMYMIKRGFGYDQLKRLLYTDDFSSVARQVNDQLREEFYKVTENEPRIVIPFYNKEGNLEMVQGRSLIADHRLKYISVKTSDDIDKIYGKYELDTSKTTYCVEGPLDSLFIDNCVATCDANLGRSNADVLVFDNQPRNREIISLMQHTINNGKSVVIWPTSPDGKEDINDMIKKGLTQKTVMNIIRDRTFSGLKAKLMFDRWKKI